MIRIAELSDTGRIAEITVFSWRKTYRGIYKDKFLFNTKNVMDEVRIWTEVLANNKVDTYVYEDNDIVKGYMTIGKSRDEDRQDSFELMGLYIDPLWEKTGVGKALLKYCEYEAMEKYHNSIVLWVLEDNENANGFYRKMGYEKDGKEMVANNRKVIRYIKELVFA